MKKRKRFIGIMITLFISGSLLGWSQKGIPGILFGLLICAMVGVVIHDHMEGEKDEE